MEFLILGLAMFYSWIHSIVIVAKKITGLNTYEKIVLWFGVITIGFYIIGTLTD